MIKKLSVADFLDASPEHIIVDARSEGEYQKGHIPGAHNLPLLNNSERAEVGTTYKREGREKAVLTGFKLTGHKFADYILEAQKLAPNKKIFIYCWRGGMRSNTMAWILNLAGFKVSVLEGGYKAYRNNVIQSFEDKFPLIVLGGKTGSGKTDLLQKLKEKGEQVIDLENIAKHKGSSFGALGQGEQPGYEQFENILHFELSKLNKVKRIWVENESRLIGSVKIPDAFYIQMREALVVELMVKQEQRIEKLVKEYGSFPKEDLIKNTVKLTKRLGHLRTQQAVGFLEEKNLHKWVEMILNYYDKTYEYGMSLRDAPKTIQIEVDIAFNDDTIKQVISAFENVTPEPMYGIRS